jgi:sarcosine oxidase subunit gamma
LNVTGDFAAELLACACPRDLDIEAFPVGACGRTLFGKAEIVLWRRAPRNFHIEVWRSYAEYVTLWLIEASRDFQIQENRP